MGRSLQGRSVRERLSGHALPAVASRIRMSQSLENSVGKSPVRGQARSGHGIYQQYILLDIAISGALNHLITVQRPRWFSGVMVTDTCRLGDKKVCTKSRRWLPWSSQ